METNSVAEAEQSSAVGSAAAAAVGAAANKAKAKHKNLCAEIEKTPKSAERQSQRNSYRQRKIETIEERYSHNLSTIYMYIYQYVLYILVCFVKPFTRVPQKL